MMKLFIKCSRDLWWNDLKDADNTRQLHLFSLSRCKTRDGIIVWQLIALFIRIAVGWKKEAAR